MTPEELQNQLNQVWGEIKTKVDLQNTEIKKFGESRDETVQQLAALEARLKSLESELVEIVRKNNIPSAPTPGERKSLGQQFADSEEFKMMREKKLRTSSPFEVKRLVVPRGMKSLTGTGVGISHGPLSFGAFADVNLERLSLRDLLTVIPTTQGAIEYIRSVGFTPVRAVLTADAASAATTLVVDSTTGFVPGQAIMVGSVPKVVNAITDATHMTITVALTAQADAGTAVSAKFVYPTAEGGAKPSGGWKSLTVESESMKTIATTIDASRQVLDDNSQLQSLIDTQLTFEVGFSEHYQILYGNGTSPNLKGILNDADHQEYNWSAGKTGDTKIDALRRAATLVTLARYPADGVAINPTDWEDIELAKGSDGHYLWISIPNGAGNTPTFFMLPVSVTEAVLPGTAVVGSWKLGAALYDREQANIRVSEDYMDYFKKNMVAVLGEERVALAVSRPEAFVEVTFDNAPS